MTTVDVRDPYHWKPLEAAFGQQIRLPDLPLLVGVLGIFSRHVIEAEDPQRHVRASYKLEIHETDLQESDILAGSQVYVDDVRYRVIEVEPAVYGVVTIYCNDWAVSS